MAASDWTVRRRRDAFKVSLRDLAEVTRYSRSKIQRLETGRQPLSAETQALLLLAIEVLYLRRRLSRLTPESGTNAPDE